MERLLAKLRPQLVRLQAEHATAFVNCAQKYDFYQRWSNNCRDVVARIDRRDAIRLRELYDEIDLGHEAQKLIWYEVVNLFETVDMLGVFDTLAEVRPGGRLIIQRDGGHMIIVQREAPARSDPPAKRQRSDSDGSSSSATEAKDQD